MDINAVNDKGATPLHNAVCKGNKDIINCLLYHGAYVNIQDQEGYTPLHRAVQKNSMANVLCLLYYNADLTLTNSEGATPLSLATDLQHNEIILHLKSVQIRSLQMAITQSNLNNVASLLEANHLKVHINEAIVNGDSLLHLALKTNHVYSQTEQLVQYLLENKADIEKRDQNGNTALHVAAERNMIKVVKIFMIHGAMIKSKNNNGDTALCLAATNGHTNLVIYLLDHWADIGNASDNTDDINTHNNMGLYPIHLAVKFNHLEIVKTLILRDKANVNLVTSKNDVTPLIIAAGHGHVDIMRFLIDEHGADVSVRDAINSTPLHLACIRGCLEAAKLLLDKGVDVNVKNNMGETPLQISVFSGNVDMTSLLIKRGASVDTRDTKSGNNLLHQAVEIQCLPAVILLLQNNVDITAENNSRLTPLSLAKMSGNTEILKVINAKHMKNKKKNRRK